MKKIKTAKQFFFKNKTHHEIVDLINEELPIGLKKNQDLILRIHARYPLIDKSSISLIVKTVFQSMRELLILGKILNFNNLFFDTKLHFFDHRRNGHILPALKVKISTPPPLR